MFEDLHACGSQWDRVSSSTALGRGDAAQNSVVKVCTLQVDHLMKEVFLSVRLVPRLHTISGDSYCEPHQPKTPGKVFEWAGVSLFRPSSITHRRVSEEWLQSTWLWPERDWQHRRKLFLQRLRRKGREVVAVWRALVSAEQTTAALISTRT